MPRVTDLDHVRSILETDRGWSLYALGDLSPGFREDTEWLVARGGPPALVMIYRGLDRPVLFTLGDPAPLRSILEEIELDPVVFLNVLPEALPLVEDHLRTEEPLIPTWRMILAPSRHRPVVGQGIDRLGEEDLESLQTLYADGAPHGEAPEFFDASMVKRGIYFGIREEGDLIAVAGTHLLAETEGVAAIGNIYVRRDRRGRDLGLVVTDAVVRCLREMGLGTIGLNVAAEKTAAIRIYERLGFAFHCLYYEGDAHRLR